MVLHGWSETVILRCRPYSHFRWHDALNSSCRSDSFKETDSLLRRCI